MDFASSTRAAENKTRWKGNVANSSVVSQRPSKVMGYNRIYRDPVQKFFFFFFFLPFKSTCVPGTAVLQLHRERLLEKRTVKLQCSNTLGTMEICSAQG